MQFDIEVNREEFRKIIPKGMSGVYFLYDKDMQLLYIGRAVDIKNRFDSHLYGNSLHNEERHKLFDTFQYVKILKVDKVMLDETERYYIKKHKPPCNTIGTGRNRGHKKANRVTATIYTLLPKRKIEAIHAEVNRLNSEHPGACVTLNSWIRAAIDAELTKNQ